MLASLRSPPDLWHPSVHPSIHPSIHQPFGVLSIPVSVSCLASSHTLNPNLCLTLNPSIPRYPQARWLQVNVPGPSQGGKAAIHCACECICVCVYGERGVKAAVTLSQDHMLAVRHAVKKLTSNPQNTHTHTYTHTHTHTHTLLYFEIVMNLIVFFPQVYATI